MRSMALAAGFAAMAAARLAAQMPAPEGDAWVPLAAESRVWFTGSSSIRRFTCRARTVRGRYLAAPGSAPTDLLAGGRPARQAELAIPAAGLGCGIGPMNRHLREALKADSVPDIVLRIADYAVRPEEGDTSAVLRLEGTLAIAGVQRPVALDAVAVRDAAGRVHLTGEQELRVTDYGIVPPRRFLGALRVRDTVIVHWDVVLGER